MPPKNAAARGPAVDHVAGYAVSGHALALKVAAMAAELSHAVAAIEHRAQADLAGLDDGRDVLQFVQVLTGVVRQVCDSIATEAATHAAWPEAWLAIHRAAVGSGCRGAGRDLSDVGNEPGEG